MMIVLLAAASAVSAQVTPQNMIFGPSAYDSGWVEVTQSLMAFDHSLGGDVDDYVVDVQFRHTDPGIGRGVHRIFEGVDTRGDNDAFLGAEVFQISPTRVYVAVGPDETTVDQVRVRVWLVPDPDWDSGWYSIAQGYTHNFLHLLGGDPEDYVVDLSFRTSGGVVHKRSLGFDKYEDTESRTKGAAWRSLDDTLIWVTRGHDDIDAYEVRARIFVPQAPSWDSGWTDLSAPQVSDLNHGLGGPWNDYYVVMDQKDLNQGTGINTYFSGTDSGDSSSEYGAAWSNLTSRKIQVRRASDDLFADQVRVRIWATRTPAYDSGWKPVATDDALVLAHGLGGDPDSYVVDLRFDDRDATIGAGVNSYKYGIDAMYDLGTSTWDTRGAAWHSLDSNQISVYRAASDLSADRVRVRIWQTPDPDADSGWQAIGAGATVPYVHDLGGSTFDYVVDMQCRSPNVGVNHLYFGGDRHFNPSAGAYEAKGAFWRDLRLDEVTVQRNLEDTSCEEFRIRIWNDPPFDWQSPITAAISGYQDLVHNLDAPPDELVVSMRINSDNSSYTNHVYQYGGDRYFYGEPQRYGAWWENLEADGIRVWRAAHDAESDNVRISLWWIGESPLLFADDFELGSTDAWSSTTSGP